MSIEPSKIGKRGWTRILIGLISLVGVGAVGYLSWSGRWPLKEAFKSLSETSQDAATTTKVKTALALSKQTSPFDVGVETRNGQVTLRGQVPSESIKSLAETIAKDTSGVKQVENNIMVNPSAERNPDMERLAGRVEDLDMKMSILEAVKRNPELNNKEIEVQVQNRSVTLNGRVETAEQKRTADQIAWHLEGVKAVRNNLVATGERRGSKSLTDELARHVEFELYSSRAFPNLRTMEIRSEDGTVTLAGNVSSLAEKLLAAKIAQSVEGVQTVENHLKVVGPEEKQPSESPGSKADK